METVSAIDGTGTATMPHSMPAALRLSLVHQTVLLLVTAVLLAVSALAGLVAWNLRSGFSDYLRLQDEAWLERLSSAAALAVARDGLVVLSGSPGALRPLLDAAGPQLGRPAPRDDGPRPRPPGPPGPRDEGRMPRPPGPPGLPGPHEGRRPPPGPAGAVARVAFSTPQGEWLSDRPPRPGAAVLQRPITVDGQVVAVVWMEALPPAAQSVDAAFLARQYRGILGAASGLLLLAVLGAVWVGRRWLRPVQEARQAAHRIAAGELHTRLTPRGNDELAGLALDINTMAASLQRLEASRRRWIAELSHEMRTPLAVLRAEVECLIDGVRALDRPALVSLQGEVARLTRLMDDFHQLAMSDLRALPCTFATLDAGALVRGAAERLGPRAAAAGLTLDCAVPAAPVQADWDRQRIDQLLTNLLENSLQYTDAPGRLRLTLQAEDGLMATLTVEDSAPGVPPEGLAHLFEPLYRADASRSRQSGGSGLGLAICQAIARSHGGCIAAQPSAWGGLCVVVSLPLHPRAPV